MKILCAMHLREILHYNPLTGEWIWRTRPANAVQIGDVAGHIDDTGYRRISIGGKQYRAHRLAWLYMTGEWPAHGLDHEDLNRLNNRWSNLRPATKSQNGANTRAYRTNTSGFKGVQPIPSGRFVAVTQWQRRKIHIGVFDTAEAAHRAYSEKITELHGAFARPA